MENKDFNEYEMRKAKLKAMKETMVAYKDKFVCPDKITDLKKMPDGNDAKVAGRIISKRVFGKLMFMTLYDVTGTIQVSLSKNELQGEYDFFKKNIDIGDFLGAKGQMYTTKVGEKTVKANEAIILSKSLRPLPEKYHGVNDTDIRYRQRYLDIIANEETRDTFKTRINALNTIKEILLQNEFVEVETPILQSVACGANARPFITKHNALNEDYYLRIAPELYLKQVVESGFNRVFEMGKNFRNEGMDSSHLQEFTMLEWYVAYWDYMDNMNFLQDLLKKLVYKIKGDLAFDYQGINMDFSDFGKINYVDVVSNIINKDVLEINDVKELKQILADNQLFSKEEIEGLPSVSSAVDLIFKKKVRPYIIQPTILYNYPAYMIPLARRNDIDDRVIDMFQLVVNGWEVVKCYSELIDPEIQRQTFEEQMRNKMAGDEEAMEIDEDFILAMEHGMPPMSGLGLGIDRIISLLSNQPTLRDVVLFPQMKKIKK